METRMELKLNEMVSWERRKAIYLLDVAANDLEMNLDGYGICDVNESSGNVYVWLKTILFLFICLFHSN